MVDVYVENVKFWNNIVYTFETICRCFREKEIVFHEVEDDTCFEKGIYYGEFAPENFKGIIISEGKFFSDIYLSKEGAPVLPLERYKDIPVLFLNKREDKPDIMRNKENILINFDIIQGAFYLVTGCEEIIYRDIEHDSDSNFISKKRLLYKEKFLYKPLVNIYAFMLKEQMEKLKFDFCSKKCCAYLHISHDVDHPYKREFNRMQRMFARVGVEPEVKIHEGFDFIKKVERKNNLRSSWYIMSGGNNRGYEDGYDFADDKIQKLCHDLKRQGDEVGWHYSYNAANDYIQMRKEYFYFKECFGEYPVMGRNHYLRYCIPESWRVYSKLGLFYDSTLGSNDQEGFIYGICTPFQLFDAVAKENLNVWEIPLILMEGTLLTKVYKDLTKKQIKNVIYKLLNEVKKYGGVFSILWHNSSVRSKNWYMWENFYKNLMKYLSNELTCATGKEIIRIYNN